MPVHTQTDAMLTLTLTPAGGGPALTAQCQVINASYTMAAPAESTPVPVACGDIVSEVGDPSNGSISGEVFKDTTANGITRILAAAAVAGTEMTYSYIENPGTAEELAWTGKCTVPQFAIDFAPNKLGRHALSLTVSTSVLGAAHVPDPLDLTFQIFGATVPADLAALKADSTFGDGHYSGTFTQGQYVILGDASKAHYAAAAWSSGAKA